MEINGKPVEDATEHLVIEVDPKDCARGKTKDPGACAAALAIIRDYECLAARVHVGVTYLEEDDRWIRYLTPDSLRTELVAFDRGASFEPGIYTLAPPPPANTLDASKKRRERSDNRVGSHHNNKTKRARHDTTNIRPRGANR